jgi:hypothetical protein
VVHPIRTARFPFVKIKATQNSHKVNDLQTWRGVMIAEIRYAKRVQDGTAPNGARIAEAGIAAAAAQRLSAGEERIC